MAFFMDAEGNTMSRLIESLERLTEAMESLSEANGNWDFDMQNHALRLIRKIANSAKKLGYSIHHDPEIDPRRKWASLSLVYHAPDLGDASRALIDLLKRQFGIKFVYRSAIHGRELVRLFWESSNYKGFKVQLAEMFPIMPKLKGKERSVIIDVNIGKYIK